MKWVYRFNERALKELKKLGRPAQREVFDYLDIRIATDDDPRRFGKGLKAELDSYGVIRWAIIEFSARSEAKN